MAKGIRTSGEFCWINILTPQPDEARRFFSELFGWTYKDLPEMGGAIVNVDGHDVGGIWNLDGASTPAGTPPGIGVVVKVDRAEETVAKVRSLGGKAQPPMDVMTNGRIVTCTDPQGVSFDLWQPGDQPGSTADTLNHGVPSWSELLTPDTKAAGEFYRALFGWTSSETDMGHTLYTIFKLGDEYAGGMMQHTADMAPMQPGWYTYVTVNDIGATVAKAGEIGAHVFMPSMEVPGTGTMAGMVSPQGVVFYAIRYSM